MSKLKLQYPVDPFYITQRFGDNAVETYRNLGLVGHNGIDLRAEDGHEVLAAHDGVITFTGEDGSLFALPKLVQTIAKTGAKITIAIALILWK